MVEFLLLGPVEAVLDGAVVPLGGRRQLALLALLLVQLGQPVTTDVLADELWRGRPPAGFQTTLRSYVSRLRRVLGDSVVLSGGGSAYSLQVAPEAVDAYRFERLTQEGGQALARGAVGRAADRLREALALWRGPALAGLDEGALRLEAQRLEKLRLFAAEHRIEAELALGRAAELVDELEVLVREHPFRERLWRHLMLALYRAERQADALDAYRRARTVLVEELGLEPSEELRKLEQAILRHEVPPFRPPEQRHNLPAAVTSFVGRATELADVPELLAKSRLVTLTGVGGVGKTRLALEAAASMLADYPDGVRFCDLAPLAEPALVARAVAQALDVREQADVTITDRLVARLRNADALLLLDNCEHLRDACAELIRTLLTSCPRLRILATSRESLGVPGEADYPVPPLGMPAANADQDGLHASEAVSLFLARARAARPRLAANAAVLATAARICSDLDGLPLAIELAAARAKALSLEEIAARLADRFRFLVSWRRLTPARHQTLREAMDWSYALLAEDERMLLARLAVFAGGFTLNAAAAVCLEGDQERALELVGRLVDASLVVADEHDDRTRYRLLETVRQYAAERLEEAGARDVARRHAQYFLEVAERAEVDLVGGRQAGELARLELEHGNIRAAVAWMLRAEQAESVLRLASALWRFLFVRGHFAEGRAWLESGLEVAGDPPPELLAKALGAAARLTGQLGDLDVAGDYAERSLELHRRHDLATLPSALGTLAAVLLMEGELDRAAALQQEAIQLSRQNGDLHGEAINIENLGCVHLIRGDYHTADSFLRRSSELFRQLGHREPLGFSLLHLGQVALHQGRYDEAVQLLGDSLAVCREVGSKAGLSYCLEMLATVAVARDRAKDAAMLLGCAQEMEKEIGLRLEPFEQGVHDRAELSAIAALGEDGFARERARGSEMMLDEVLSHALAASPQGPDVAASAGRRQPRY